MVVSSKKNLFTSVFAVYLILYLNNCIVQVAKATVQVSKRPTAFGALLGQPASGRRPNLFPGFSSEQVLFVACCLHFSLIRTSELSSEDIGSCI